jgi:amidophosphoribosyltransferase
VVISVPDTSNSIALGYSEESGIRFELGLIRNHYVGRTFIQPDQGERDASVRIKFNPVREVLDGQRVVVVDDSIVRGTTTQVKMNQLREAGAREIHLRISCLPIRHPCYFGVDFACYDQLIAHNKSIEEIRAFLGVDSLHYLSMEGMLACVQRPSRDYCTACYSGDYRLDPDHPVSDELATTQLRMF